MSRDEALRQAKNWDRYAGHCVEIGELNQAINCTDEAEMYRRLAEREQRNERKAA